MRVPVQAHGVTIVLRFSLDRAMRTQEPHLGQVPTPGWHRMILSPLPELAELMTFYLYLSGKVDSLGKKRPNPLLGPNVGLH